MKNAVLLVSLLIVAPAARCAAGELRVFPAAGVTGLDVAADNGAVVVTGAEGKIEVEITGNDEPEKCRITTEIIDGTLTLKAEGVPAPRAWKNLFGLADSDDRTNCRAGFTVLAPAALPLEAKSGTGSLKVSGRSGPVRAKAGTGDVSVSALTGSLVFKSGTGRLSGEACAPALEVKSGTGDVDLKGLCGPAEVKAGTGEVRLAWAKAPASGEVRVNTGTADIDLAFPEGTKLAASLKSGTGSVSNEFAAGGTFSVTAKSGTGSIALRKMK
ncbi:MAG TPA: hypothetical protein DCW72_10500 [Elusimicrobia bacterium]|nr:MAG: hypothetical protein A2X29_06510 [Elusimicrobia bacterium GWA2_64_40]OGR66988.1 MAG: hypothetical protein A2X30_01530 [Elusimicrobia bacterium GWB2_63_16]HAN04992.1 hypothetical protein [Elusimicrobiota bacterium]HAU90611.1 hypothetical protein [Elusimicrobiota bacterium]